MLSDKKPEENLHQRAYLNSIASLLDYGAKTITGFILTPFLVSGLGSTLFGVWNILGQFAGYTNLTDIKATQVLKWAIARDREAVDENELREYVTATFVLVMSMLPLLLIAGGIISWYAPVITRSGEEYADIVRVACLLLVLSLVVKKVFDIFESILRGMNLGFKQMGMRAIIFVAGGGLKILAILLGYGLICIALVEIFISLIIGIILYVLVKKHVTWFGFGRVDLNRSKSFLKTSGWFIGWTGTKMLLMNTDKILLGYIVGPVLVTQFVISKYLAMTIQGIITNVVFGVIPGFGKLYGNNEFQKLLKVREHLMLITWLLSLSLGFVILVFNQSFVELWIGSDIFIGQTANLLIIVMVGQYMLIHNDSNIINVTLDIKSKVLIGLLAAIISIGVSWYLIKDYGVIGLCTGFITGRILLSISYPLIVFKKTGKGTLNLRSMLHFTLISAVVMSIGYIAGERVIIDSWLLLLTSMVAGFIILLTILFYIGFNKNQKLDIIYYIRKTRLLPKSF